MKKKTLAETSMAPENTLLGKDIPIGNPSFLGAFAVSFREVFSAPKIQKLTFLLFLCLDCVLTGGI